MSKSVGGFIDASTAGARAAVARAVSSSWFHLAQALGHCRQLNPKALGLGCRHHVADRRGMLFPRAAGFRPLAAILGRSLGVAGPCIWNDGDHLALVRFRHAANVGRCRNGNLAALDSAQQVRHTTAQNLPGARNCSFSYVQQVCGSANWQTLTVLVSAPFQIRQTGRHHGALTFS